MVGDGGVLGPTVIGPLRASTVPLLSAYRRNSYRP